MSTTHPHTPAPRPRPTPPTRRAPMSPYRFAAYLTLLFALVLCWIVPAVLNDEDLNGKTPVYIIASVLAVFAMYLAIFIAQGHNARGMNPGQKRRNRR
jgi:uncharacterized RDD family membrane protein YckC